MREPPVIQANGPSRSNRLTARESGEENRAVRPVAGTDASSPHSGTSIPIARSGPARSSGTGATIRSVSPVSG